ncbi:MAG: DNA polymerase I, partial [uncultured Solirubrobacteraceae bacterium]
MAENGDQPRELFLIDGNSLAYRAFFALPESIATSDGKPTNAIFGFASMFVKLLTDYGTAPTVVVWDAGLSGRKEISAEYKAQRSSRPDLLKEQWPHLAPLVEAFGYTNVSVEGYEADDVIATLAAQAKGRGVPVMVVTGDRDAYQLVGEGVRIMSTSRGVTDTKIYDVQAVIDRYGIGPELVPDFIGLKGDTSDNIPGVPGIGDKTASDLLQRFGTLEKVLESVDEISGAKRKENLTNHADDARMSKALATMVFDVPVELDMVAESAREPDRSRLREEFRRWELRDPLRRLEEALALAEQEAIPRPEVTDARTVPVRRGTVADVARLGGGKGEVALVVRAPEIPEGELLPVDERWSFGAFAGGREALAGQCDDPTELVAALDGRPIVAHDAKSLGRVPDTLAHDTEVAAYLLDPARRSYVLDELCEERGLAVDADDPLAAGAVLALDLAHLQREQIRERGLEDLLVQIELPLVRVLRFMETTGVKLDTARLARARDRINADAAQLEREIWEMAGEEFVIGSPQQLGHVLFEKLGLSKKRRGKTGFSTDARVLQAIRDEHEIIPKIERFRELSKLAQTYLEALPNWLGPDGRLHTTFQQTATATGRLSSIDPNLQNIPVRTETGREIRACFVAEEGHRLLSVDYSQVELRVLAHIAGEDVLKDIFRRGEDVHTETASAVFDLPAEQLDTGMRSKAKMV